MNTYAHIMTEVQRQAAQAMDNLFPEREDEETA